MLRGLLLYRMFGTIAESTGSLPGVSVMAISARRAALRSFLIECRARLRPEDVGLASIGRRRVPGLRREEVADLARISPAWYTLLETAPLWRKVRVSPRTLDRLASALRLSEDERIYLFRLAIDELPAPRTASDSAVAIGREYRELLTFAKRAQNVSSERELADLTTDLLFDFARPVEIAYFVEANLRSRRFAFFSQRTAPNFDPVSEECLDFSAVHDAEEVLVRGNVFAENNVAEASHAVFADRAKALGSGRFISAGVKASGFDGAIGYFQRAPEPFTARERNVLGLIAKIVGLALAARS